MKNKKQQFSTHKRSFFSSPAAVWAVLIVVVAGLGWYGYVLAGHKSTALPSHVATKASPADNKPNDIRKKSSSPAPTLNSSPTTQTAQPAASAPASITVTRASIVDNHLQVGTLISGATSGTCVLTIAQTGQATITQTASVTKQNNSYLCPVFSIPTSQFPNQGKWDVFVTLQQGGGNIKAGWVDNPVDLSEQK